MKLMTVKDLARESQLSKSWWRQQIKNGKVPAIRLGRRVRIAESDYLKMLEQSRVQGLSGRDG